MTEMMTDREGLFQELVSSLSIEVQMYKELDLLLKGKQTSIISGDVETLQNIVHEEQRLIPRIQKATQAREICASTIGAESNLRVKSPSLKELIDLSPSHHSQKLIGHREELIQSLDRIAHANRENEFLLNSSVDLVRGLVQVLLGSDENENVHYGGRGVLAKSQGTKTHVDCQV